MAAVRKQIFLDQGWRFRSANPATSNTTSSWQPSRRLPTEIHLDLLANEKIPDPFLGKNEEDLQWVGEQTWVYELDFDSPADLFGSDFNRAALVFEGLDTFATVKLNGREVLKSSNMFVSHRVEISRNMLVKGRQCLQIMFENAERIGDDEVSKFPDHDWFSFSNGTARLATRKAQYHYGWDWGPKLMTCGPWKPVYLDLYSSRISDVSVHSKLASDHRHADVEVVVQVEGPATQVNMKLYLDDNEQHSQIVEVAQTTARATFRIQNPKLWWPFTLGQANLYTANISLYGEHGKIESKLVDETKKRFGIRKVELVQTPAPNQDGSTFFFRINDVPIFAAGSCWIPADSFASRISEQRYKDWVKLARNSNQVMIRVWGGGIYEHPAFYDTCDELGVMVWQDFMFACGNYPAHPEMRKQVAIEADQNVRLLRHHPSIVLWCGNNEDYIIPVLRQIEYDTSEHDPDKILASIFPARYFYEHVLPAICAELAPETPYWPGSPYGGSMANSQEVGDIHQWHVWHLEMFPYQDFPRLAGRFVSEFGMQALPRLETVKEFFPRGYVLAEGEDVSENEFVKWHNKMDDGGDRMAHYGKSNIAFEATSLPAYIYSTQLIQSEALSAAYRSWKRLWQGPGKEFCGGALVWQLNDCWPVTSWAIADYYLRPKMAFWAVKRECAPLTAGLARVLKEDGGRTIALDAWAVNMTMSDINVGVSIHAWEVSTGRAVFQKTLHTAFVLKKNQSTELGRLDLDALLPAVLSTPHNDEGYKDVVFAIRLTEMRSSATVFAQSVNFHEPLREVPFAARSQNLQLGIVNVDGEIFVTVAANMPIKGLLVQVRDDPDAMWDENGLDLVPGQVARMRYLGKKLEVGQEDRLEARWLGGEWKAQGNVRASL